VTAKAWCAIAVAVHENTYAMYQVTMWASLTATASTNNKIVQPDIGKI